jgi:hypothetical protein
MRLGVIHPDRIRLQEPGRWRTEPIVPATNPDTSVGGGWKGLATIWNPSAKIIDEFAKKKVRQSRAAGERAEVFGGISKCSAPSVQSDSESGSNTGDFESSARGKGDLSLTLWIEHWIIYHTLSRLVEIKYQRV